MPTPPPADAALARLAGKVLDALRARGLRLALAESCTGGWIAKVLTDVPGSSDAFTCGFVTYANTAKQTLLDVPAGLIASHGAVSREVVEAMAFGAARFGRSDCACAVSGIAGPGGGTPDKPVGTVWFAWRLPEGSVVSESRRFEGDREAVRRQAVAHALDGLLARLVREAPEPLPEPVDAS